MHTKDILAAELRKINLEDLAVLAEKGEYHDYLSPHEFPALRLYDALQRAGTP